MLKIISNLLNSSVFKIEKNKKRKSLKVYLKNSNSYTYLMRSLILENTNLFIQAIKLDDDDYFNTLFFEINKKEIGEKAIYFDGSSVVCCAIQKGRVDIVKKMLNYFYDLDKFITGASINDNHDGAESLFKFLKIAIEELSPSKFVEILPSLLETAPDLVLEEMLHYLIWSLPELVKKIPESTSMDEIMILRDKIYETIMSKEISSSVWATAWMKRIPLDIKEYTNQEYLFLSGFFDAQKESIQKSGDLELPLYKLFPRKYWTQELLQWSPDGELVGMITMMEKHPLFQKCQKEKVMQVYLDKSLDKVVPHKIISSYPHKKRL